MYLSYLSIVSAVWSAGSIEVTARLNSAIWYSPTYFKIVGFQACRDVSHLHNYLYTLFIIYGGLYIIFTQCQNIYVSCVPGIWEFTLHHPGKPFHIRYLTRPPDQYGSYFSILTGLILIKPLFTTWRPT